MTKLINKQIGENPHPAKVVLFVIKAVCGVLGGSLIVNEHPYIGLLVLVVAAAANEVITMYNWNK